jgi:HTH-type transcriptional regulator/antitoxin HigA
VLATLIEAYEAKHWPIEAPDPVSAILETMERLSLKQSDLAALVGSRSRASEILARKRPLTMRQAWALHQQWHIPAAVLLRPTTETVGL